MTVRGSLIAFAVGLSAVLAASVAAAASRPPVPPADQTAKVGHPGWLVEQLHGCWIWDFTPSNKDVVTWSGPCAPNGPATGDGVLEWKGNLRFYGTMKDGRKTGHGSQVTSEGDQYEGDYKDGVFFGHGVYIWADGSRYDGEWNNNPEGLGEYTDPSQHYRGQWKNGCFRREAGKTYLITIDDSGSCD
jgi:hypothetical protein